MSPMAHYLRGLACGGAVFFGGFIAFVAAASVPGGGGGAPPVSGGLRLLARLGVPGWLGFPLLFFAAFGLSAGGAELTRRAFRRLVPVRCPECGGRAYGRGTAPVTYVCRHCGHSHDTGIREGEEA
jgi:DNA-directed RNA polymerase subunit RPC12/RpoP